MSVIVLDENGIISSGVEDLSLDRFFVDKTVQLEAIRTLGKDTVMQLLAKSYGVELARLEERISSPSLSVQPKPMVEVLRAFDIIMNSDKPNLSLDEYFEKINPSTVH